MGALKDLKFQQFRDAARRIARVHTATQKTDDQRQLRAAAYESCIHV